MDFRKMAATFKALGDENRIRILELLNGEEKCACRLLEELSISQPTLSHHMKILCDAGIVLGRKDGKWMYYRISAEGVRPMTDYLSGLRAAERCSALRCDSEPCCGK